MKAWTEMTPEERAAAAAKGDAVPLFPLGARTANPWLAVDRPSDTPPPPDARTVNPGQAITYHATAPEERKPTRTASGAVAHPLSRPRQMTPPATLTHAPERPIVIDKHIGTHRYTMTITPRGDPAFTGYSCAIDGIDVSSDVFELALRLAGVP